MKPTVCLTFDEYDPYATAFQIMHTKGLVGTFFANPDLIDVAGGVPRDHLTVLKMSGWTIGAYTGCNMVSTMTNDRNAGMQRLIDIRNKMLAKGFNPRSLAPNQRSWDLRLRNVSVGLFERVRVADNVGFVPQPLPLPDPLWIKNGGTLSLGNANTAESLAQDLASFIAQPTPGLWSVVIHKVGAVGDDYTVTNEVFSAFCDQLCAAQNAGSIRVVGYDDI